jgi:hypothetical protein
MARTGTGAQRSRELLSGCLGVTRIVAPPKIAKCNARYRYAKLTNISTRKRCGNILESGMHLLVWRNLQERRVGLEVEKKELYCMHAPSDLPKLES